MFEWKGTGSDHSAIIILNECGSEMTVSTLVGTIRYQRHESEEVASYLEAVADLIRRSE